MLHLTNWVLLVEGGGSSSTFLLADQLLRTCGQWCCGLLLDAAAGVVAAVDDLHCRLWSVRPLHPAPPVQGVIITVTVTPSRDDNVRTWRTSASPSPSSWPASARDGRRSAFSIFVCEADLRLLMLSPFVIVCEASRPIYLNVGHQSVSQSVTLVWSHLFKIRALKR